MQPISIATKTKTSLKLIHFHLHLLYMLVHHNCFHARNNFFYKCKSNTYLKVLFVVLAFKLLVAEC